MWKLDYWKPDGFTNEEHRGICGCLTGWMYQCFGDRAIARVTCALLEAILEVETRTEVQLLLQREYFVAQIHHHHGVAYWNDAYSTPETAAQVWNLAMRKLNYTEVSLR